MLKYKIRPIFLMQVIIIKLIIKNSSINYSNNNNHNKDQILHRLKSKVQKCKILIMKNKRGIFKIAFNN